MMERPRVSPSGRTPEGAPGPLGRRSTDLRSAASAFPTGVALVTAPGGLGLHVDTFIAASLEGWAYCRDNPESCRDIVVKAGSKLGASHQLWQVNEINKLIWPSPAAGVGTIDQAAWDRTVQVALQAKNADGATVLTKQPDPEAFTNEYVSKALETLKGEGVDVVGSGFTPETVTLNAGGA